MIKRTHVWLSGGEIKRIPFDPAKRHIRKQFPWVPDGVYDHSGYEVRYVVEQGFIMLNMSKMWIDSGGPDDVDIALRLPWGTYNDMPPKPGK